MTPDHATLRALCEAATPGPWVKWGEHAVETADGRLIEGGWRSMPPADAAFIAAANPTTVRALLDEIERLTTKPRIRIRWHQLHQRLAEYLESQYSQSGAQRGADELCQIMKECVVSAEPESIHPSASIGGADESKPAPSVEIVRLKDEIERLERERDQWRDEAFEWRRLNAKALYPLPEAPPQGWL